MGEAPGEEEAQRGIPFVGGAGQWLNNMLRAAKRHRTSFCAANTMCCRPPANIYPTDPSAAYCTHTEALEGIRYCRTHIIQPFLDSRDWHAIYALGNKPLQYLTGRYGIETWRGSPLPLLLDSGPSKYSTRPYVVPTIHPAAIARNAKMMSIVVGDLRKSPIIPPEHYTLYPTPADLAAFTAKRFAFDFEWDWTGEITLCGLSSRMYEAIVVPFTDEFIPELRRIFEGAEELIGHNIVTADTKHLDRLGWDISHAKLTDTLLIQHLVQPDMRHSLAFCASVFTNKVFWKGADTEDEERGSLGGAQFRTWNHEAAIPVALGGYGGCASEEEAYRLYNARDTDASFQIAYPLTTLLKKYDLESTYEHVSVPIGFICRDLGAIGIAVDRGKVIGTRDELAIQIDELDAQLPVGLRSYTVEHMANRPNTARTYKVKRRTCKGPKGSQHDPVVLTFTEPGEQFCPVCRRSIDSGKMVIPKTVKAPVQQRIVPWNSPAKIMEYAKNLGLQIPKNHKTQRESTDKNARKRWVHRAPEFHTVDQIKKLSTLRTNFAKPGLISTDRMYFNLLPHGTAEGRLSSTGQREGIDLNIQNIPGLMKRMFVPDHEDWCFLDLDICQGENNLTALFAKDHERMERLADPAYDEHSETATFCFGVEVTKTNANKHLRKAGKVINHMLNYGAGWFKLQENLAFEGFSFTAAECKNLIFEWRALNARTARWQDETIATARRQGYLTNPFGRKRWLQSRDYGPKALAFLPASTLADCVLRMMIAMYHTRFSEHLEHLKVAERMDFTPPWRMVTQVHDSIVVTGPKDSYEAELANIRRVMEQPWHELGGFRFRTTAKYCPDNLGEGVIV